MTTSVQATDVSFDDDRMWVTLDDGRTVGVPLAWYPRLLSGSPEARADVWISPTGLHWDGLDEDISVEGILIGQAGGTRPARYAA